MCADKVPASAILADKSEKEQFSKLGNVDFVLPGVDMKYQEYLRINNRLKRSNLCWFTFVILILAITMFPWPSLTGVGLMLTLNLLVWLWLSVLMVFTVVALLRRRRRGGRAILLITAGAALMTLPLFWTPVFLQKEALPRLAGLWAMVAGFYIFMQWPIRGERRRFIYRIVVLAGVAQVLLAIWQVDFPLSAGVWLGFDPQLTGGRPIGGLLQANLFGSFVASALVCAVWLMLTQSHRDSRKASESWHPTLLIPLPVSVGLLTVGVVLSHSRSAQASSLFVVPLLLWCCRNIRGRRVPTVLCLLVGLGASSGLLWLQPPLTSALPALSEAITSPRAGLGSVELRLTNDRRASDTERLALIKGTLAMIMEHPLTGHGLGSFETAFPVALARKNMVNPFTVNVLYPHNELLYVWSEGGLPALVGLLLWLAVLTMPFWKAGLSSFGRGQATRGLLIFPLMIHVMSEFPLYLSALHGVLLIVLLRLALPPSQTAKLTGEIRKKAGAYVPLSGAWMSAGAWTVCLLGGLFMITALQSTSRLMKAESFSLMDPIPYSVLFNPYAQADRIAFDRAVSDLMQYDQTHKAVWLTRFEIQAVPWINLHNDANLTYSLMQIARYRGDQLQAEVWRQRGCLSFSHDLRFNCESYPVAGMPFIRDASMQINIKTNSDKE